MFAGKMPRHGAGDTAGGEALRHLVAARLVHRQQKAEAGKGAQPLLKVDFRRDRDLLKRHLGAEAAALQHHRQRPGQPRLADILRGAEAPSAASSGSSARARRSSAGSARVAASQLFPGGCHLPAG